MKTDHYYFGRRAKEEREAAMKAPHLRARQAHIELARRYAELADAIAERESMLARRVGGRSAPTGRESVGS
jgi:hypothetical protein